MVRVKYSSELYHHGIKGQKWGNRRYQNEDGSLTAAGRLRYGVGQGVSKAKSYISSGVTKVKPYIKNAAGTAKLAGAAFAGAAATEALNAARNAGTGIVRSATASSTTRKNAKEARKASRYNSKANLSRSKGAYKTVKKFGKADAYRAKKAYKSAKMDYKERKWRFKDAKKNRGIRGAIRKVAGIGITAGASALATRLFGMKPDKDAKTMTSNAMWYEERYRNGTLPPADAKKWEKTRKKMGYTEGSFGDTKSTNTGKGNKNQNDHTYKTADPYQEPYTAKRRTGQQTFASKYEDYNEFVRSQSSSPYDENGNGWASVQSSLDHEVSYTSDSDIYNDTVEMMGGYSDYVRD